MPLYSSEKASCLEIFLKYITYNEQLKVDLFRIIEIDSLVDGLNLFKHLFLVLFLDK